MIKIKDLTVKFDKTVLKNVNLTFEKGVYCISAPSGRGKTTLLNAIAGLIKYKGEIEIQGNISYIFQDDRLLNWLSAKENIMLVEPDKNMAEQLMEKLGVSEFQHKKVRELSGGMKRRCALVRGLAYNADIYLLDEPFRALDENNAQKVRDIINAMAKDKLFIVVTHNEEYIKLLNAQKVLL